MTKLHIAFVYCVLVPVVWVCVQVLRLAFACMGERVETLEVNGEQFYPFNEE